MVLYYSTVGKEIRGGPLTISIQHKILSLAKSSDKTWSSKKPESLHGEFVRGGIVMKVRPLHAPSVASPLITTEAVVAEKPKKEQAGPPIPPEY